MRILSIEAIIVSAIAAQATASSGPETDAQAIHKLFNAGIARASSGEIVDPVPLHEALLEYAARFPDERRVVASLAGKIFEYGKALGGEDGSELQIALIKAMKTSPNDRLREFVQGKERIHRMRSQPLELSLVDIEGHTINLTNYRGKVVLLDFWGANCSVCIEAMPHLKAVYREYGKRGFEIIGVVFADAGVPKTRALRDKLDLPWPQSLQEWKGPDDTELSRYFSFTYVPNYFLLDQSGRLVTTDVDHGKGPKLEREVRRLLGLPPLVTAVSPKCF